MIRALVDLAAELLLHVSTSLTADDEANNATRRIDNAASEVPDFNVDWLGIREIISLDISPKITPPPARENWKIWKLAHPYSWVLTLTDNESEAFSEWH